MQYSLCTNNSNYFANRRMCAIFRVTSVTNCTRIIWLIYIYIYTQLLEIKTQKTHITREECIHVYPTTVTSAHSKIIIITTVVRV